MSHVIVSSWKMSLAEHITHVDDCCHVAFGQVLIIRFGTTEHITHAHEFANIPLGQVPVEGIGLTEHEDHAGDLCHIPLADRSVRSVEQSPTAYSLHASTAATRSSLCRG